MVDGKEIDVKMFKSDYIFRNISQNHMIKVVYEKEDNIPDIDNSVSNDNSNNSNDGNTVKEDDVIIKNEKPKQNVNTGIGILDNLSLFKYGLVISATLLVAMIYTDKKHKM